MTQRIDIPIGTRFEHLTVIGETLQKKGRRQMAVRCDCGKETVALLEHLRGGGTKSCGCLRMKGVRAMQAKNTRHGMSYSPEYAAWQSMVDRCTRVKNPAYPRYGGRGITVSDDWMTFDNFYRDIGPRPSAAHSLDRLDNDRGYEAGNVEWRTHDLQMQNRGFTVLNQDSVREIRRLFSQGVTQSEIARRMETSPSVIHHVVHRKTWRNVE